MSWRIFLERVHWRVLLATLFLSVMGILSVASATLNEEVRFSSFALRQTLFVIVGVSIALLIARLDYRQAIVWSPWLYGAMLFLLIAVFIGGQTIRGAQSWFEVGIVQLQPAEFAKVIAIIVLARYFSYYRHSFFKFRHILRSLLLVLPIVLLVALQPDFGSAALILMIWVGMVLITGVSRRFLLLFGLILLIGGATTWTVGLQPYQKTRILAFLQPQTDPLGAGYNAIQSTIAVGSGGLFGRGLGQGSQSQLNFLPEQHTDFIFAVISEELGLVGAGLVLLVTGYLIVMLVVIGRAAADDFGFYIAIGGAMLLFVQSTINIGMNMGIMPITGVPLPLVSYGGSSYLSTAILIGVVMSVSLRGRIRERHQESRVEPSLAA